MPPRSCSGAMYGRVPTCAVAALPFVALVELKRALPKSQSSTCRGPSASLTRTFSSLRSRWTMPRACRKLSASRIWAEARLATASGGVPCLTTSNNVPPSAFSITT